ncbi:hypothetical protein MCERE19_01380 [Spirosomataceae bacterium]
MINFEFIIYTEFIFIIENKLYNSSSIQYPHDQ